MALQSVTATTASEHTLPALSSFAINVRFACASLNFSLLGPSPGFGMIRKTSGLVKENINPNANAQMANIVIAAGIKDLNLKRSLNLVS